MVRHKNRYVIVEINEKNSTNNKPLILKPSSIHTAILQKVQQLYGDFGVAAIRAGFTTKYCNENTRVAIIRIRHGPHRIVTSCLPLITIIEERNVDVISLYTGATVRQCFKFLIKHQQSKFDKYCAGLKTDEEILKMKEGLMNIDTIFEMT